jgi:hypothetical protein
MSVPNVDTFEHDIAEEIKTKEASLPDIASASGDVGNTETSRERTSTLLVVSGAFFVLALLGGLGYFLFAQVTSSQTELPTPQTQTATTEGNLFALSTYLYEGIADHVSSVRKNEYGYALTLTSYTPVFSYMIKNEQLFADELAVSVGSPRDTSSSSLPFLFSDTTLSNQTMRVGTSGSSTVIYAFVNSQALVVSSTTEGILTLRNAILSQ